MIVMGVMKVSVTVSIINSRTLNIIVYIPFTKKKSNWSPTLHIKMTLLMFANWSLLIPPTLHRPN